MTVERYSNFIKCEKTYSSNFFKLNDVCDNGFDENEYTIVREVFKDTTVIEKIFESVEKIFGDSEIKYIAVGDFLFSILKQDLNDSKGIITKISRAEYLRNIRLRAKIITIFGGDYVNYIEMHKKLLIALSNREVIRKISFRTFDGTKWGTDVFIRLNLEGIDGENIIPLWVGAKPFIIIKIWQSNYSLYSFRNIWKAKRKKKEMEDFKLSYVSVKRLNQICMKISKDNYNLSINLFDEWEKKMLGELNLEKISDYFEKLRKLSKDVRYASYWGKNLWDLEFESNKKWRGSNENYLNLLKYLQGFTILNVLRMDIYEKNIYLPCFMDNRGRQYQGTILSPTFYKVFRYMYEIKKKGSVVGLETSKFYKKIIKYKENLDNRNLDNFRSYIYIVLLIEVGKFFIKNGDCIVKTEKIIESGIKSYTERAMSKDMEENVYLLKIYKEIDKVLSNDKINMQTLVFKDATSSGLQNYGILLGYKEEMLKYLNIDSDDWCDTYKYIIDKFLENKREDLFKRKYWKGTIMTIPYNSVWYGCFVKFLGLLREDGIIYNDMSEEEQKEIRLIHKKFYDNVKNKIKEEFYANKKGELKKFKYNKLVTVGSGEYKINFEKKRDKYTYSWYTFISDEAGTKRSLEANNMHYLDARLVKTVLNKFEIIPVHDCFGIRLFDLHLVMDEINNYYSKKIGRHTYSPHIII